MPSKRPTESGSQGTPGVLFLVATPIGNLGDITLRALETLRSVDVIAAEDTRRTRKLISHFDIHKPLVSYREHNAKQVGPALLGRLSGGERVALVSDAGTPGISDPGTLLVQEALQQGIRVEVVPGPAALVAALAASGLPTDAFAFLGFPPSRGSGRKEFFAAWAELPITLILYESPHRLKRTLQDILESWGNRRLAVARELTKLHEEVFRGTVTEAQVRFGEATKGEVALVVEGARKRSPREGESDRWQEELCECLDRPTISLKEAVALVASKYALPRKTVYGKALEIRRT